MGFNYQGATAGLLAVGGRLATNEAYRLEDIENRKIEDAAEGRRQEALLKKKMSLEVLGYTQEGAPVTREEYEGAPEGSKPILYSGGLKREKAKEEKPHEYKSEWGKNYADAKASGKSDEEAVKFADEKTKKEPDQPDDKLTGKYFYKIEGGQPIKQSDYWNMPEDKRPKVAEKAPDGSQPDKAREKEGKARKEIVRVNQAIARLKAGNPVDSDTIKSLSEVSPELAAVASIMGGGKEVDKESRDRAIKSLEEYRDFLTQDIPKVEPGILEANNNGVKRKPLDSFITE